MDIVIGLLLLLLGLVAGVLVGLRWGRRDDRALAAIEARGEDQAVIRDGLERLHDRMRDLEQERVAWQGRLHQQVDDVRLTADQLRRETASLATALRKPQVRGRWGELHLRRTVELAGMVDHCDFEEQLHLTGPDGAQRPDLVVHLAGGRSIVVDSKVPLDAHLDALATDDDEERQAQLRRHARQLRTHVESLAGKAYWRALPCTPEFVVLFVPTEASLAAALEADPTLLDHAATRNVVVASPTTLIALLRTVAHGWTTEALAESTREVHELGRDLHARLGVLGGHLDKLGRALKGSVEAYNSAVGSLESRVLVTARQFEDIGVTREALPSPDPVRDAPRPLTAPELLDAVAEPRPELPAPGHATDASDDRERPAG